MSHIAKVSVKFKSLDDLDAACRRVGLQLVRGQATFYTGRKCEHAIRPQSNEAVENYNEVYAHDRVEFPFGVIRKGDAFEVAFETMQWRFCNPMATELKKSYAAVAAIAAARRQGFSVQERRLQTGEIKLVFSK